MRRLLNAIGPQNLSLLVALLVLVAIFGSLRPDAFFSPRNFTAILNAITILGIVAMAQTVVIISGGIDVSVGSIVGMASVVAALAMSSVDSAAVGILAAVAVGGIGGAVNGLLVTKGRVNPIITTLATLAIFQGVAYIVSNGKAIGVLNTDFNWIGAGRIAGVPMTVIVFSVIAVLMVYFMRATDMGRNIYAIGGNPNAARLAGIRLERYRVGVYTLTGLICGVAAVLLTARSTSGQPSSGSAGLELEAITAAFLGGCAMAGGRGTIVGTILGVLIIGTLNNGMLLMMVPNFYQLLAKGVLLLGAVMIMEFRTRRPA
ncbi:ABC transporter permease [Devosia sp.]|uniref:ABC transporter permease n=1 Tax=Devosia sp. TaxID=1871048 RepID=UPI0025C1F5A2|nr:ABC transporter permease [Devosia sp.]